MQNTSLDDINPSNLKNFFKKLCRVNNGYKGRELAAYNVNIEFDQLKKYKSSHITTEKVLSSKVQKLEEELQQIREEKNKALGENRNRIDELSGAIVSIKTVIHELLEAKKQRIRHLERKIGKEVKF